MKVALVLPPREGFGASNAGAVALTVKDTVSQLAGQVAFTIYGGAQADPFSDYDFVAVKPAKLRLSSRSIAYARKVVREVTRSGAELVEVHNRPAIAAFIKSRLPRTPVIFYLHNDPETLSELNSSAKRAAFLRSVDQVICVSQFLRERFIAGVDGEAKVTVIYNTLNYGALPEPAEKQQNIVFVGRMVPEKGGLVLAQSLALIADQLDGWTVTFAGAAKFGLGMPTTDYERSVVATLGQLGPSAEYLGGVDHRQILKLFARASIAVVPSLCDEAFGRTLLEAMSANCACITSGRGGLPEVAGASAIVLQDLKPEVLAENILKLVQNSALRSELQLKAGSDVRQRFDIQTECNRLLGTYRALTSKQE